MNVLIILGHPDDTSLNGALADAVAAGASQAGAQVRVLKLGALQFDPVLRQGYKGDQPLEPDLADAQKAILAADHLVWVFPVWWGGLPALLKGFIDRVFLPGFAFRYRRGSSLWDRLLTGRRATVLATMDFPGWYYRWLQHRPAYHQLRASILGFAGVKLTGWHSVGPVRPASEAQRKRWLEKAHKLGATLARGSASGR
jgi:NAD(P)H dehydrogenase (quinone)